MGVGMICGVVPAVIIWAKVEEARSQARIANKILKIKDEYIEQLQTHSREESARFTRFAMGLLEEPKPTDTRLN